MDIPSATNLQGLGIPFYSESEWLAARTVMDDGHTFHASYAEFVARVEDVERQLRGQGKATVRVYLRMVEFVPWCRQSGRQINADARAQYAAIKAMENDHAGRKG